MRLTEFSWQKDDSGHYKDDETLDCQIGITSDGQYEIRNHLDPSQSEKFQTPQELGEALAKGLEERANR